MHTFNSSTVRGTVSNTLFYRCSHKKAAGAMWGHKFIKIKPSSKKSCQKIQCFHGRVRQCTLYFDFSWIKSCFLTGSRILESGNENFIPFSNFSFDVLCTLLHQIATSCCTCATPL